MKTIAEFPAFAVVDLEAPVIHLTAEVCADNSGLRFCTAYESRRHGTMYREVSPNCVDYYCAQDEGGIEHAIERNRKNGGERFWFNNCASSITSHARAQYTLFLIRPGQHVVMAGHTLAVRIVGDFIRLDVIALPGDATAAA